ncbi:MAG: glycoside hydrolase family protein [Armatimonadota bacterium]
MTIPMDNEEQQDLQKELREFHGDGFFAWQTSSEELTPWSDWHYDEEKYWGGFSKAPFDPDTYVLPDWAIGPFQKYIGNPIFRPDPNGWDCGHPGGGVHNGSVLHRNGKFYYIYRGEFPIPDVEPFNTRRIATIDYMCDVGVAVSDDGINFTRMCGPVLRRPEDWMYSFEDVNCVEYEGRYYMFLNRWDWLHFNDPSICGTYLAVSDDLVHWEHKGLVFPDAKRIHRNAMVVQDPQNRPVRDDKGRFIMYINDGLIAYSTDLLHWESHELDTHWPGGECSVAMANYHPENPDHLILFTGGHHTGHFYGTGEVLFSLKDPEHPIEWLPRPILTADSSIPYEDGKSVDPPHETISHWRDTVFACGMTLVEDTWYVYYGGSEYYTCLALGKAHSAK